MQTICSIGSSTYAQKANSLFSSAQQSMPEVQLVYLCIDEAEPMFAPALNVKTIKIDDLGLSETVILDLRKKYNVIELSTSLKPLLLKVLLSQFGGSVIYMDPDILVVNNLYLEFELSKQFDCIITPHRLTPSRQQSRVPEEMFLRYGIFNLGFIAVSRKSLLLLDWWWQKTQIGSFMGYFEDVFTDQKWANFFPVYFNCHISRDPGLNLAIWNIDERRLEYSRSGVLLSNECTLKFIHFSQQTHKLEERQINEEWKFNSRLNYESYSIIQQLAESYTSRFYPTKEVMDHNNCNTAYNVLLFFRTKRNFSKLNPKNFFSVQGFFYGIKLDIKRAKSKAKKLARLLNSFD